MASTSLDAATRSRFFVRRYEGVERLTELKSQYDSRRLLRAAPRTRPPTFAQPYRPSRSQSAERRFHPLMGVERSEWSGDRLIEVQGRTRHRRRRFPRGRWNACAPEAKYVSTLWPYSWSRGNVSFCRSGSGKREACGVADAVLTATRRPRS